jgi:hypothetical protein
MFSLIAYGRKSNISKWFEARLYRETYFFAVYIFVRIKKIDSLNII